MAVYQEEGKGKHAVTHYKVWMKNSIEMVSVRQNVYTKAEIIFWKTPFQVSHLEINDSEVKLN